MPCGLAGIFEMQILKSEVSGRLAKSGYLKYVNGGCKFSRLTRRGRDILLRAAMNFLTMQDRIRKEIHLTDVL